MVTCFAYGTISEAACARQRLPTISCGYAMCLLHFPVISHDFPLTCPVSSPCHNFGHSFATCVAIAFRPQCKFALSLPPVLPRAFARSPNFAIEFAARAITLATYLPVFFCHRCCHYLCARRFFSIHIALQIATAIATALLLPSRLPWLLPSNLGA